MTRGLGRERSGTGRAADRTRAEIEQALCIGLLERAADQRAQAIGDGARRPRGRHQRKPGRHVEPGQAGFRGGGHVRKLWQPTRPRDRERAQRARPDLRHHRRRVGEHARGLPGQQRGDRLRAALVGHVQQRDARGALEQLGGEVHRAAGTGRREHQPARLAPGDLDEFLQRSRGVPGRHDQHDRHVGHQRDGRERLVAERQLRVQARIHAEHAAGREQQLVAVGGRMGDRAGPDVAPRPGTVVHGEGLRGVARELLGHVAREHVRDAAGAEPDDDANGARGPCRLVRRGAPQAHPCQRAGEAFVALGQALREIEFLSNSG